MGRPPRFVLALVATSIGLGIGVRQISAQTLASLSTDRRLTLPVTGTSGLNGAFWRRALSNGGSMPSYERLLVVAADGRVLAEVNGTSMHVLLPEDVFRSLSAGTLHATLVHNHPAGVSLSGDDLAQLGKPGVDRVIAVGHDGSVFEASIGAKFNGETFETVYRARLAEVMETVLRAARRDNIDPSALTPLVCHLVAEVLDRAEVIDYRTTLSLDIRLSLDRYHRIVQSAVGLTSSR